MKNVRPWRKILALSCVAASRSFEIGLYTSAFQIDARDKS